MFGNKKRSQKNNAAKGKKNAQRNKPFVPKKEKAESAPVGVIPIEKIAKIDTADLPIVHRAGEPKEHYVYVREYDKERQVYKVNICTHLEKRDMKTGKPVNDPKNIQQVKYGNTYPVPIHSANFPVWTGIKREVYEVPKGKMRDWDCVKFKKKHSSGQHDGFYSPPALKK